MGPTFFLCGGRGTARIFLGGGKGKKYCATCKVIVHCPHGRWTITFYSIGRGRDEKARRWGLHLCFELFVLYKMGCFKDATREVGVSERFKKIVGSFYDYCFGRV